MVETRVSQHLVPPEPPPEASQPGVLVWLRKNLFYSRGSTVLTVVVGGIILLFLQGALGFLLDGARQWEVIPRNSANYSIGSYPRENIARTWVSLAVVAAIAGLATAAWRPVGRVSPGQIAAAVRSAGLAALVLGILGPSTFGGRTEFLLAGAVLVVLGQAAMMALGDRAIDPFIPTLVVAGAGLVLFVLVLWLLPIASSTQVPWTIVVAVGLLGFGVGRLLIQPLGSQTVKRSVVALALFALPVLYLHVQRAPDIPWDRVLDWSAWLIPIVLIGYAAVIFVSGAEREAAAIVNGLLVVASIAIWFVSAPMAARFLLLMLTGLSLATPTFGSGEKGRRAVVAVWTGVVLVLMYLFAIGVGTPTLETNNNYFAGLNLTFMLAIVPVLLSFPLGILMALGRTSTMPLFRLMSTGYIELIRGVPLITVLFFFRFGVLNFLPPGLQPDAIFLAILGITLFAAAYLAENIRGGLQSIPKGQYEAAKAMGMTTAQMTMLITLPQALRAVIPAIVGQIISLFKDTSLVSIIGLAEFLRVANNIVPGQPASLGTKLENLVFAAVVYWVFTFTFSRASQRLERRLGVGVR
jgi:general L-amino acid transport system permease protein